MVTNKMPAEIMLPHKISGQSLSDSQAGLELFSTVPLQWSAAVIREIIHQHS